MKKLLMILICLPFIGVAESIPQGINYQAVARDTNGEGLIVACHAYLSACSYQSPPNFDGRDWGSTKYNNNNPCTQVSHSGYKRYEVKYGYVNVRAVRTF